MRIAAGILWAAVLFVCTCTVSFKLLLTNLFVHFLFNPHPNWSDLLIVSDFGIHSSSYLLQKVGHFLGFFILSILLTDGGKKRSGLYWCMGYALATEILQLHFYRDGRLYDVVIDSAGIWLAYFLCKMTTAKGPQEISGP